MARLALGGVTILRQLEQIERLKIEIANLEEEIKDREFEIKDRLFRLRELEHPQKHGRGTK
jgi:uncharacterized protein (UPF0335 family)